MKDRCNLSAFVFSALSVLLVLGALSPREVEAGGSCRRSVIGTYLTTAMDGNVPPRMSRSIITLHSDHTLSIIDRDEGGSEAEFIDPFSDAQGAWRCTGRRSFTATTLNFTFPGPVGGGQQFIVRADYDVKFDRKTKELIGMLEITFFNLFGDFSDPLEGPPLPLPGAPFVFTFEGQRVTAD